MFNLISLKVKCPMCNVSLMDKSHPVDNNPGIKMEIDIAGEKGNIWLSSIYESYNYDSDLEVAKDAVAKFYCPTCLSEIISKELCASCNAPLVPFHLEEGGKVTICSRAGCKAHFVAFEDLSTALTHFYEKFSEPATEYIKFEKRPLKPETKTAEEEEKEIIHTGTFLSSYCPHCKRSLIENGVIIFKIENENGETGHLMLSPYLNVFTHKSTIKIPEKQSLKNIKCFHCDKSLLVEDKVCPECGSEIAKIMVTTMTKMVDFYLCSKKGCTWHGLSDEDMKAITIG